MPATAGVTTIAIAYRAIQHGYEPRFVGADALMGELSRAASRGRLDVALEPYLHPHVRRLAGRVWHGYSWGMKTAISIPDRLFNSADALARRLGLSRSRLYATALAEYVAKHQAARVTDRLNAVYSKQPSELEPGIRRAQSDAVARSEW
jgi:hypothetical protein